MKNKLLLVILTTFSIISCNKLKESKLETDNLIDQNISKLLFSHLEIDNMKISPIELINYFQDSINLSDVVKSEQRLFLLISENCCQECVHRELKRISELQSSFNTKEIVILLGYSQPREQYAYIRYYNLNNQIFSFYGKTPLNETKILDLPLYFVLDNTLRIKHPLYVSSNMPIDFVDNYIRKVLSSIND